MPTLTKTDKPLTKTESRRIIARLRRHDPDEVLKRLYVAPARGETWVATAYWATRVADWPWAPILANADLISEPYEPGTYELRADAVVKVSDNHPAFGPIFPADWPDGQTAAAPVDVNGVAAYTTNSRPLLRLGDEIIAVNLDLAADLLGVPEVPYTAVEGGPASYGPWVRFTGDPEHPLRALTVWRWRTPPEWVPIGLLMPVKAR